MSALPEPVASSEVSFFPSRALFSEAQMRAALDRATTAEAALATAEAERDAAHNNALEKAAEAVRDIWTPYKRVDLTEVLNLIRALKKETKG